MRRLVLAVLMASISGAAFSQSVPAWNGSYAGVSLGVRSADVDWRTTTVALFPVDTTTNVASLDSSTGRIGGFLGYNWQIAPTWVAGLEADLAYADKEKTMAGIPGTHGPIIGSPTPAALANDTASVRTTWDGSLRGRIGYLATPATLLYLAGGVAWQKVEVSATCTGIAGWCVTARSQTNSTDRSGWTLGGGVESVLSNNWLMRAEYRYADYGSSSQSFFGGTVDAVTADVKVRTHTALIGLVYRFK